MSEPLVLLCNPPSPRDNVADREGFYGMGAWLSPGSIPRAPHTLAWCGAVLRDAGWRVAALDAVGEGLDEVEAVERITRLDPALLVLLVSPTTAQYDLQFIRLLRRGLPGARFLLVGLGTRYLPHSLVQEVDMVLVGEPEGAVDAACTHLLIQRQRLGERLPEALNVTGYDGRGHLLGLAALPMPAWELFRLELYASLPVVTTRGCTYRCRYCPVPVIQGRDLRARPTEAVVGELLHLHREHGVTRIHFSDPLFGVDREATAGLCEALVGHDVVSLIAWSCETRPEHMDLQLLQRMKSAGCASLHLGLESVSPETLMAVGRVADPLAVQNYLTRVREVVMGCRAFEIACHLHVISGLPGNRQAAAVTRTFLRAYATDSVSVSPLVPFPGTSIFPTNQVNNESAMLGAVSLEHEEAPSTEPVRVPGFFGRLRRVSTA